MSKVKRYLCLAGVAALLLVGAGEAGARMAGTVDFPLYLSSPTLGYIPAPNQHGRFLDKNDWAFNEHSMGVARPFIPDPEHATLLIGDSLVLGGNPYKQADKLGPQLGSRVTGPVWPVGAGSWALLNEIAYIDANPDVEKGVGRFVFVVNSGDLVTPSRWRFEVTHPTHRPPSALVYLFQKYVLKAPPDDQNQIPSEAWRPKWRAFAERERAAGRPILVVAYPNVLEAARPDIMAAKLDRPLTAMAEPGVTLMYPGHDRRWGPGLYRDAIHPTPAGMALLADLIAAQGWPEIKP
jgi:hypothetical protein